MTDTEAAAKRDASDPPADAPAGFGADELQHDAKLDSPPADALADLAHEPAADESSEFPRDDSLLAGTPAPAPLLVAYVITKGPTDSPERFIVQRWEKVSGEEPVAGPVVGRVQTIAEARALVPDGFFNVGCLDGDAPEVFESWILVCQ